MNIQNTIMSVALVPFPFRLSLLCAPWWLFHIYFLTSTTKLCKTSLHRHSLVALQQESSAVVHLNWTQTRCSSSWSWRTIGFCSRIASTLAKHATLRSLQTILHWNCLLLRCHVIVHQDSLIIVEACIYHLTTLSPKVSLVATVPWKLLSHWHH